MATTLPIYYMITLCTLLHFVLANAAAYIIYIYMHEININRFNGLEKRKTILRSPILGIGLSACWHITLFFPWVVKESTIRYSVYPYDEWTLYDHIGCTICFIRNFQLFCFTTDIYALNKLFVCVQGEHCNMTHGVAEHVSFT